MSVGGSLVAKSCLTLAIHWTVACHAPLSVGFSRLEYRSGLSFPSPEDLPDPGIEPESPASPALQVNSLLLSLLEAHLELHRCLLSFYRFLGAIQNIEG